MKIVRAKAENATTLTVIAFAAKRHWGYPDHWLETWRNELTVTPESITHHETYFAEIENQAVGFYMLESDESRIYLMHFWIMPTWMGQGVGRALFSHALERIKTLGFHRLEIEADPHAVAFYEHLGARRIGANIYWLDGQTRNLPVLACEI